MVNSGGGVHAGADGPAVVFGKKNLDYQPKRAAKGAGGSGAMDHARSDFSAGGTDDHPYAEYNNQSTVETTPMIHAPYGWDEKTHGVWEESLEYEDMSYMYYQDAKEMTHQIVDDWVEIQEEMLPEGDTAGYVAITGTGMGWMKRTGYKTLSVDDFTTDPVEAIAPNTSEYNQSWKLDNGVLSISQSHHDAPMGEGYSVVMLGEEETQEVMEEAGYDVFYAEDVNHEVAQGKFDSILRDRQKE